MDEVDWQSLKALVACVRQVNHLVEKALTNEDLNETDIGSAPRLLEIILQNCRGRVDHCLGHYIALALNRWPASNGPANPHRSSCMGMLVADVLQLYIWE